jgi:hypothetical protein
MTLPDAPKPEKSNLYRQLSSEQLATASTDNFQIAVSPVFLDASSEDELRRINLMGQAANLQSQSGPFGQGQIIKITDTTGSGTPTGDVFVPDDGQVWVIVGAQIGAMNANKCALVLRDATTNQTVQVAAETSAFAQFDPVATGGHVFITKNLHLEYEFTSATGDCIVKVALQRVR